MKEISLALLTMDKSKLKEESVEERERRREEQHSIDWQHAGFYWPDILQSKYFYRFQVVINNCKKGDKILDIGAGRGELSHLGRDKDMIVESVESAPYAKEILTKFYRREFKEPPIIYSNLRLVPNNSYDAVAMLEFLEHVMDPEAVLKEAWKKLKKGGLLFITTPLPGKLRDMLHVREFKYYSLSNLIRKFSDDFIWAFINKEKGKESLLNCYLFVVQK